MTTWQRRARSCSPPRPARARRSRRSSWPRGCCAAGAIDRVAVVCPTTPLTRQWAQAAGRLGLHLAPDAPDLRPPQRLPRRRGDLRAGGQRGRRRSRATCTPGTLVIADEAHHLGEELAWGDGFDAAFAAADAPAAAVGHAVPLRRHADPGRALRPRRRRAAATSPTPTPTRCATAICRPVTFIPYDGTLSVAQRRRRHRGRLRRRADRPRGVAALPHGDLDRAARRAAADPARGARAADAPARRRAPRRGRARRRRRLAARRARSPSCCARSPARRRPSCCTPSRGPHGSSRRSARARERVDRRGQHGLRGRRHPAPARRRLRDRRQDAADLPPDRRALRPRASPAGRRSRAGSTCPATRCCAPRRRRRGRAAARARAAPTRRRDCSTSRRTGPRPSRREAPELRAAVGRRRAADVAVRRRAARAGAPAPPRRAGGPRARAGQRRCRPSSAASACARSATGWSPTWAASRAGRRPRSTPGSTAQVGVPARAGRDDRAARAVDRPAVRGAALRGASGRRRQAAGRLKRRWRSSRARVFHLAQRRSRLDLEAVEVELLGLRVDRRPGRSRSARSTGRRPAGRTRADGARAWASSWRSARVETGSLSLSCQPSRNEPLRFSWTIASMISSSWRRPAQSQIRTSSRCGSRTRSSKRTSISWSGRSFVAWSSTRSIDVSHVAADDASAVSWLVVPAERHLRRDRTARVAHQVDELGVGEQSGTSSR